MTVKNKTELAVDKTFQMKNYKNRIGLLEIIHLLDIYFIS